MSSSNYNSAVLEDDPILYWPCNEGTGTSLTDASGNGNTGTITGNADLSYSSSSHRDLLPIQSGKGLDLNRTGTRNGYAYINPVPASWPTTAATFEMWYVDTTYSPTPDGAGIFSYCTSSANTGNDWMLWWDVQTEFQLHVNESDTTDGFEAGGTSPFASASAVKYLAITWDGVAGTAKLYINGELVCTKTKAQYQATLTGGGAFVVGQDQDSVMGGFVAAQAFAATVSNIAVYNTVLSAARIKAHWDAHVEDLAYPVYDATPSLGGTSLVDTQAPVVTQMNWTTTDPGRTSTVTVRVTDNDPDNLDVELWAEFPTHSQLIYANGASTTNYSVGVLEHNGDSGEDDGFLYAITPLGAGWEDDFTLTVVARDLDNKTIEEFSYELDVTAETYPPHMDPYT